MRILAERYPHVTPYFHPKPGRVIFQCPTLLEILIFEMDSLLEYSDTIYLSGTSKWGTMPPHIAFNLIKHRR